MNAKTGREMVDNSLAQLHPHRHRHRHTHRHPYRHKHTNRHGHRQCRTSSVVTALSLHTNSTFSGGFTSASGRSLQAHPSNRVQRTVINYGGELLEARPLHQAVGGVPLSSIQPWPSPHIFHRNATPTRPYPSPPCAAKPLY